MTTRPERADLSAPPVERKADGELYGLTAAQRRRVRQIVGQCANYAGGDCLMLDSPCAQAASGAICCRWFRWGVLEAPENVMLKAEIFQGSDAVKRCLICGKTFVPKSNRATYCGACAKKARRERQRGYMREKRGQLVSF